MRWTAMLLLAGLVGGLLFAGIVPPGAPIPAAGEAGAPHRTLSPAEQEQFLRGRALFDKDFGRHEGLGPVFNGDSCRACHLLPVIGGAGPIDVNVQRPAVPDGNGGFVPPEETGGLAQTHSLFDVAREEIPGDVAFVEERNTPTILGLGLIETISDQTILAGQDPDDTDQDGVRGVAHMVNGNVGRFGWKAQVASLRDFVRDAMSNELGITVPDTGNPVGDTADSDGAADPELSASQVEDILFFMQLLDFAPKFPATQQATQGEALFQSIGCAKCHTPRMDGVELYSDLLLHDVLGEEFTGVTQGEATSGLYRTPPLRGVRDSAPYFHDGRSETLDDAIRRHTAEAEAIKQAYAALNAADRAALLAFLAIL